MVYLIIQKNNREPRIVNFETEDKMMRFAQKWAYNNTPARITENIYILHLNIKDV